MKKSRIIALIIPVFLLACLATASFLQMADAAGSSQSVQPSSEPSAAVSAPSATLQESEPESLEPEGPVFEEYDVSLMALGDNLMHMGIVKTGRQPDGTLDYGFLFRNTQAFIDAADVRIINQETIFAGNDLGFSGFPRFNSPQEVGDAIVAAGFNVVLHATNHAADQGVDGIKHCAAYWENHPDVLMTGIRAEKEENPAIPLITVKDVTFAVLNYTYGPNMGTLSSGLRGRLDVLCAYDEKNGAIDFTSLNPKVLDDIRAAGELADVVIVCPHWGTEYQKKPSVYQKKWAEQMTEAGADLIIGTHPHVPQPVEWITSENGNRALCYYSLGNYVSTQKQGLSMLEEMAWVTFHVTEEGVSLSEEKTGVLPLVCQYKYGPLRLEDVYLLEDYTEDMALRHGIRNYGGVKLQLSDLEQWSTEIFGEWILEKNQILGEDAESH